MTLRLKGLCRSAIVGAPLLALAGCDFGYDAGYHFGFNLGYETKRAEIEQASAVPADLDPASPAESLLAAAANPGPAIFSLDEDFVGKLMRSRGVAPATTSKAPTAINVAMSSTPQHSTRPSANASAQAAPTGAPAAKAKATPASTRPSGGAAGAPRRPPVAAAPFAPLRPGPGGGGAIIHVGNGPQPGGDKPGGGSPAPGKPGDDNSDDGNPGGGNPGGDNTGGGASPDPGIYAPSSKVAPVAKITIIDTTLLGKGQSGGVIGVSLGSSSPAGGQLVSANLLSGDARSVASVGVVGGGIASVSVLPTGSGRSIDSLAAISVGNAPLVSGGQAPLVSISALPDLGGVTGLVSPVTGALLNTSSTGTSDAQSASVGQVVGATVNGVGQTAGALVGALTKPLSAH